MTTIRRSNCVDQLLLPTLDLCVDGKVCLPKSVSVWSRYSLAAEAPGGKIVGFIWSHVDVDKRLDNRVHGSIIDVLVSRFYNDESIELMESLVLAVEEIFISENTYYMKAVVPLTRAKTIETYLQLGYSEIQGMVRSSPTTIELWKELHAPAPAPAPVLAPVPAPALINPSKRHIFIIEETRPCTRPSCHGCSLDGNPMDYEFLCSEDGSDNPSSLGFADDIPLLE